MTIADILTESFPGQQWSCRHPREATIEEQYAALEWVGPAAKPTLAEILAAELTDEQRAEREAARRKQETQALATTDNPTKNAVEALATAVVQAVNVRLEALGQPAVTREEILGLMAAILSNT